MACNMLATLCRILVGTPPEFPVQPAKSRPMHTSSSHCLNRRISTFATMIALLLPMGLAANPGKPLYPVMRDSVAPADNSAASRNPPVFLWPREGKSTVFEMEIAASPDFSGEVIKSPSRKWCFHVPRRKFAPGTWYWRYRSQDGTKVILSPVYSFTIRTDTPVFETPEVATLVANLPKQRPYMLSYGQTHQHVIETAKKHPELVAEILKAGEQAYKRPFIDLNALDRDKLGIGPWLSQYGPEVKTLPALTRAYLVTGDDKFRVMAEKRIDQCLGVTLKDLMAEAERLRFVAEAYDTFHDSLDKELKHRMLAAIRKFLAEQYAWWPGNREAILIENHFWQLQISGFFLMALATVADMPENMEYLNYAYDLFLARVPTAGGNDGGWANGLPYFTVEYATVCDMAYYLHALGKVDVFSMPWYRNLPAYFLYCGLPGAPMDGFGNMHDRAYMAYKDNGVGWNFGHAMCMHIAAATNDPMAKLYCAQTNVAIPMLELSAGKRLQFTTDTTLAASLPSARQFREIGEVAMHTHVLEPKRDMAVYFRSSPFGAFGHMHANQNAFNIAARGERVFYSSGYYTDFNDRHTITSYRHTRAHNTILVSGRGQAYGTEGYGWIKRYAHGDKLTYVCGDASKAYVPVVDKNWSKTVDQFLSPEERAAGFGDARLRAFDRHLVFLRPGTVLIYDVLESEVPQDWSFLLHTYKQPAILPGNRLDYTSLPGIHAGARVFAANDITLQVTDQFTVDHRDKNPRYKDAENHHHASWTTKEKTKGQRFFAVIQCTDAGTQLAAVDNRGGGEFRIGDFTVKAALNPDTAPSLTVQNPESAVFVNAIPATWSGLPCRQPAAGRTATVLIEKSGDKVIQQIVGDTPPVLAF